VAVGGKEVVPRQFVSFRPEYPRECEISGDLADVGGEKQNLDSFGHVRVAMPNSLDEISDFTCYAKLLS